MINFSSISQKSILGRMMRIFLKLIPQNTKLFILQGKLKGKKWIKGSGVNGYWLGSYEPEERKFFEETVKKGDVVFDIGSHVGFYALLASELVGEEGKVFAFEPLLKNLKYLKKHIKINNIKNIDVIEAAASDKEGTAFLENEGDGSYAKIVKNKGFEVKTVVLDNLVKSGKLSAPNIIKIDVEGAEFSVLKGAAFILKKYGPAIFLSIHIFDDKIHKNCCDFLKNAGYGLKSIAGNSLDGINEIFAYKND